MTIKYLDSKRIRGSSTGDVSSDSLGSAVDGTNNGATADSATAINGKASLTFDNSNDWISLGTGLNSSIDGNAFSISAWVYVSATNLTDATIIGKQIAGYSSPYHVFNVRAHSGNWSLTTNDGSNYQGDTTTAISHTGWTHIVATFDGTSSFKVYADNVEVCSYTNANTNWSNSYWSLGNGEGTTRWWDSEIQDVAFWSRVLTSGERATLLNSYAHGTATSSSNTGKVATDISTTGLLAYYTLNDTTTGVANWTGVDEKATLVTGTEVVASQSDGWANFEGGNEYCYYNDSGAGQTHFKFLHDGSAFSFSIWLYRNGNQSGQTEPAYFGDNGTTTSDVGFTLFNYNTSGGLRYFISNGSATTTAIDTTVADTTWTNIIVTYTGSAGTITVYKDGVSVGTYDASSYSFSSSDPAQQVGFMNNIGRGSYLTGRLSMTATWKDHCLSAADVAKLADGRRPTTDGTGFDYTSSHIRNLWFYDSQTDDEIGSEANPNLTLANAFGRANWVGSQSTAPTTTTSATNEYSSDLPENTLFEETDTRETYFLQDNTGISKAGCLGYWKFQEQSGVLTNHATTANGFADGLGSAADGAVDGTIDRTAAGKFRTYAYDFTDSVGENVSVPDQAGLDITGDLTLTTWIYPTSGGSGGRVLFAKRTSANSVYGIHMNETSSGVNDLLLTYWDSTNNGRTSSTTNISLNEWHFLAVTITSNQLKIWVDMVAQSHSGSATLSTRVANSASLNIGTFDTDAGEDYAGRVQDSTVWNRGLSEAELTFMYNSGHGIKNIASGLAWY